jgi:uncharacterized protein YndB with AHSA1/START domain
MHFHNVSLSVEGDLPRPEKYRDLPEEMSFTGKVTRCEPPYVLHHTWEFSDQESSEVCYELSEVDDKVLLVLTHRKLDSSEVVLDVCGGWHTHLNILEDVLAGQTLRPFYRMHAQYQEEYQARLGLG